MNLLLLIALGFGAYQYSHNSQYEKEWRGGECKRYNIMKMCVERSKKHFRCKDTESGRYVKNEMCK